MSNVNIKEWGGARDCAVRCEGVLSGGRITRTSERSDDGAWNTSNTFKTYSHRQMGSAKDFEASEMTQAPPALPEWMQTVVRDFLCRTDGAEQPQGSRNNSHELFRGGAGRPGLI
jgi:hypothetical protein